MSYLLESLLEPERKKLVSFKEYLIEIIRRNNSSRQQELERDIEVILTYYGMGSQKVPTYESTAAEFNIGSRQRVEQIIKTKFKDKVDNDADDFLKQLTDIIKEKEFHSVEDFLERLRSEEIIEEEVGIKGLMNLLNTFGYANGYGLYSTSLKKATNREIEEVESVFIIKKTNVKVMSSELKKLHTAPGMAVLAEFNDICSVKGLNQDYKDYYLKLLNRDKQVWTYSIIKNEVWYLLVNRDNIINHCLAKLLNVSDTIQIDILSNVIYEYYSKRSFDIKTPDKLLIKEYLLSSGVVSLDGEFVTVTGEKGDLIKIECQILEIFSDRETLTMKYPVIYQQLLSLGYTKVYIDKVLYHAPFIYIDRTLGRKNYCFNLVSMYRAIGNIQSDEAFYENIKSRLQKLQGETDASIGSTIRNEQAILRRWLFEGKTTEVCAICGKEYSVTSMVTAHKKKRSVCSEAERTDPNIVMPVCLFGCDYMYEVGSIYVQDGIIKTKYKDGMTTTEKEYLSRIEDSNLINRWLRGSKNYFKQSSL